VETRSSIWPAPTSSGRDGGAGCATRPSNAILLAESLCKASLNAISKRSSASACSIGFGVWRSLARFFRIDFDPLRSDADFLVEFEPVPVAVRMKNYLALREALGVLLSRPMDLIEDGAIRNPYVLQSVTEQEQVLYAA